MKAHRTGTSVQLIAGIGFLMFVILAELGAVLRVNHGFLAYTLDDPYIHLALAENILQGHYGVNMGDPSAPSSSILWPFLLAPFSSQVSSPFLLNVACALATVFVFARILQISVRTSDGAHRNVLIGSWLIILIVATNLVGLVFTGMEHTLQLLCVSLVAWGLVVEAEEQRATLWLLGSIVAAPLVRYENMAVCLPAIGYLVLRKHLGKAVVTLVVMLVLLGAFSLFLVSLGLEPIPASISAKAPIVRTGEGPLAFYSVVQENIKQSLFFQRQGLILLLLVVVQLCYLLFVKDRAKKYLALAGIVAAAIHLTAGQYGWYNRYEVYILGFLLLGSLYLVGPAVGEMLGGPTPRTALLKIIIVSAAVGGVVGALYIAGLNNLRIASNNIYSQQYQMHRFAAEYYAKAVAVHDLGYVSYKNNNYVMDLWGLASREAFMFRMERQDAEWAADLCEEKNIELAMIYDYLFTSPPKSWIKIGELHLGKQMITPADSKVAFYATNQKAYAGALTSLRSFVPTLPDDVRFVFNGR